MFVFARDMGGVASASASAWECVHSVHTNPVDLQGLSGMFVDLYYSTVLWADNLVSSDVSTPYFPLIEALLRNTVPWTHWI